MHTLFPPGMGRLGTIFAFGLALWAAAGAGRAIADDPPGCGNAVCCLHPVFWQGYEPLPLPLVCQQRRDCAAATVSGAGTDRHGGSESDRDTRLESTEPGRAVQCRRPVARGACLRRLALPGRGVVFLAEPLEHVCPGDRPDGQPVLAVHALRHPPDPTRRSTTAWSRSTRSRDWRTARSI